MARNSGKHEKVVFVAVLGRIETSHNSKASAFVNSFTDCLQPGGQFIAEREVFAAKLSPLDTKV